MYTRACIHTYICTHTHTHTYLHTHGHSVDTLTCLNCSTTQTAASHSLSICLYMYAHIHTKTYVHTHAHKTQSMTCFNCSTTESTEIIALPVRFIAVCEYVCMYTCMRLRTLCTCEPDHICVSVYLTQLSSTVCKFVLRQSLGTVISYFCFHRVHEQGHTSCSCFHRVHEPGHTNWQARVLLCLFCMVMHICLHA